MRRRKSIPDAVEAEVLDKCARRCCICFRIDYDFGVKLGQIAHLDRNPSNNHESNLAYLCLDHHSQFDSTTRQHKNYSVQEVKAARRALYEEVKGRRRLTPGTRWTIILDGEFEDFDRTRVQAMAEHLRRLLRDPHLTIESIEEGSVRLTIRSARKPFPLRTIEEWGRLFGRRILEVWDFNLNSREGFMEFQNKVAKLCKKKGLGASDAEDIAMAISIQAYGGRGASQSGTWTPVERIPVTRSLNTLLSNALDKWYKKEATVQDSEIDKLPERATHETEFFEDLSPQELTLTIEEIMRQLDLGTREVVLLRSEGFSTRQIADRLGVSPSTVSRRFYKARKTFRQLLGEPHR